MAFMPHKANSKKGIQKTLKTTSTNSFQEAWKLYEDAFPPQERRLLHEQKYIL